MDFQIKNILVGFDNSRSAKIALHKAADTAKRFDAKLHAVYVYHEGKADPSVIQEAVQEYGTSHNMDIEFLIKTGKVYTEITTLEREIGADMVIIGTHGNSGWQPFWIGSNAFRVASTANCPVITILETTKEVPLTDILLPLDNDETTRQKVPYAAMMAKAFDATVHIFSATKSTDSTTKAKLNAYGRQTEKYLHERGIKTSYDTQFGGDVTQNILEYSKKIRAGLVMIMADTESKGLIMGSYSQDIVNNSVVPVMVMHSRDLALTGAVGY
ncbi:MAG: nucleotide-binding universal stress UspA family protein [Bacteroidia bacterium]|jgi:nucleotide-binding universal stress UspA family protein